MKLVTFSDTSHGRIREEYGPIGIITGFGRETFKYIFFHPISWTSQKQRKISYSSFCSEILAAADEDDRACHIKEVLAERFPQKGLKRKLIVDSKSLFETIPTLHRSEDYRPRNVDA